MLAHLTSISTNPTARIYYHIMASLIELIFMQQYNSNFNEDSDAETFRIVDDKSNLRSDRESMQNFILDQIKIEHPNQNFILKI
ncbi:MAG: hypothetical protein MHMPM18_002811 [Marteilia pararefringens]